MEFDSGNTPFGSVMVEFHQNGIDGIIEIIGTKGKGFLVDPALAVEYLTKEAIRQGEAFGALLCYPEDTTGKILAYELPDSTFFRSRKVREKQADIKALFEKCPEYVRERGLVLPKPTRKRSPPAPSL